MASQIATPRRPKARTARSSLQVVQAALEERLKPDRVNGLPREILLTIFSLFDVHTLLTCASVCKTWFDIGTAPYFSNKLRAPRISSTQFPPLLSWNPLEYYNLFSLAAQTRKTELANYEFFNCSKYCDMLKHTELGSRVSRIGDSLDTATRQIEHSVEARMKKIRMNEKVTRMSEAVKRMKEKMKNLYKEKTRVVRAKIDGLVEDATTSSRGIRGKFKAKVQRFQQKMKEFYHERTVGPTSSYHCIGHQMRNFVLSSVLLQHVAFSVLLWRHWDKSEISKTETGGLLATVGVYWVFALLSMYAKRLAFAPQWLLYSCMSLALVNMQPFEIVAFDHLLLLLTITLATVSVFDIYHRLYKESLIYERAVLQDHLFMALQVTILFLHLNSAPLVTCLTAAVAIFTWRDFCSFFQLQRGQSVLMQAWQLVQTQIHEWLGFAIANCVWLMIVRLMAELPFSMLHGHLNTPNTTTLSLVFLAAELTLLHCCIVIKYKIRYDEQDAREAARTQPGNAQAQNQGQLGNAQIPVPPPLPPHWARQNAPAPLLAAAAPQAAAADAAEEAPEAETTSPTSSLALLHPTVYWHYVWILGVFCDFLMGLLDRLGFYGISQSLSLVLPIIVLVAVLPVQLHYWNNKWNYDLPLCHNGAVNHVH